MKKLYLHVGFSKTATTSFQQTCGKNADKLEKQGFIYPIFNSTHIRRKNIVNHGDTFCSLFSESPDNYYLNVRDGAQNIEALYDDYSKTLQQSLEVDKNIIISGESISRMSEGDLKKLKLLLERDFMEIIPLAVVRSPYEFVCSMAQNNIKTGRYVENYFLEYSSSIIRLKNFFPNIEFFPFKEICKHSQGPVGFLLEYMGVDYQGFNFVRANESVSNTIVRIQNEFNKIESHMVGDKLNPNFIRIAHLDKEREEKGQKFLLTEEEYNEIKDLCDEENNKLRELLGEEFTDKNIKFSQKEDLMRSCALIMKELHAKLVAERKETLKYQKLLLKTGMFSLNWKYWRYHILSLITFGKKKAYYEEKKSNWKSILQEMKSIGK